MSYIYQIENDVNGKLYVGKTEFSIEKRFKEHCSDAFRDRCEKRPLYAAMRKYGVEHFHISLIEETDRPEEREIYWIKAKDTYKNGYNVTLGGDGKRYCDYDVVFELWQEGKSIEQIHTITKYDKGHISNILSTYKISSDEKKDRFYKRVSKSVKQIDINTGEVIAIYDSANEAARQLGHVNKNAGIGKVCRGQKEQAYGYKWEFVNND